MGEILLSVLVAIIMLGGPLTLYLVIKILNHRWGGLRVQFAKVDSKTGLLLTWDNESFEIKVARIKLDFIELVPGGRAFSHSFTFEDSEAKRKSFFLELKIDPAELAALTDAGVDARAIKQSSLTVEIETVDYEGRRVKFSKRKILAQLAKAVAIGKDVEIIADKTPDKWSVQTRVFPWKKVVEAAEDGAAPAKKGHAAAPSGPRAPVDFAVTKVWIEPGCIVCDACEAEAPLVFWVQAETCIVRENAPLDDAAAIKAAAEGCPVDVIKYTKVPKAAAAAAG